MKKAYRDFRTVLNGYIFSLLGFKWVLRTLKVKISNVLHSFKETVTGKGQSLERGTNI